MQKFSDTVLNSEGQPILGVSVTVKLAGTNTLASLFSDNVGTVLANPVTTGAFGSFSFYAVNGRYDLYLSGSGISPTVISDVLLEDLQSPDSGTLDVDITGNAATASVAALANTIANGAVSSAAKIAGNIITLDKLHSSAFGEVGEGVLLKTTVDGKLDQSIPGTVPASFSPGSILVESIGGGYAWKFHQMFPTNKIPTGSWKTVSAKNISPLPCVANNLHLSPFYLGYDRNLDAIGVRVASSSTAGKSCYLVIYSDNDGVPYDQLLQSNLTAMPTGAADLIATFSSQFFEAGKYWLGIITDSATVTVMASAGTGADPQTIIANSLDLTSVSCGYKYDVGSLSCPSQLGIGSLVLTPEGGLFGVRVG